MLLIFTSWETHPFFPPSFSPTLPQTLLGWKYEVAFEETQTYKDGKYVY